MERDVIIFLMIGSVVGGLITGLSGFGMAIFSLVFFLEAMPPQQAVPVAVILSAIVGVQCLWPIRQYLSPGLPRAGLFFFPALLGIPLGVESLAYVDVSTLKILLAVFLIVFGGSMIAIRGDVTIKREMKVADAGVGFLGGYLAGLAGVVGVAPTIWCALKPWEKDLTRAVIALFGMSILSLTIAFVVVRGAFDRESIVLTGIALPATVISVQIGFWVYSRLSSARFRKLLLELTFLSGIVILIMELL